MYLVHIMYGLCTEGGNFQFLVKFLSKCSYVPICQTFPFLHVLVPFPQLVVSPELPKEPSFLLALTASSEDLQEADEKGENPGTNEMEEGQDADPSSLARPTDLSEECAYLRPPKRVKFKGLQP